MTQPILAEKVPGRGRMYRSPATQELMPSITNIVDVLAKPWLGGWMAKMVAGYAFDNRAALMEMSERDAAVDFLKGSPYRKRDQAAGLGDVIHSYVEATLTDQPLPDITEAHQPYVAGFLGFLDEFNPQFRIVEGTVFNHVEQYSGTFDFLALIDPLLILGDWKSGSGIFDEVALQLAALRHADGVWNPITGELLPMPRVDECIAVHLQPGNYAVHRIDAGPAAYEAFLGLRQAWDWNKSHQGAVGPRTNRLRLLKSSPAAETEGEGVLNDANAQAVSSPAGDQEALSV